jgi:hypothetical protein
VSNSASSSGGSGSGGSSPQFPQPPAGQAVLSKSDVDMIVRTAVATANADSMAIAVVDRLGVILASHKRVIT